MLITQKLFNFIEKYRLFSKEDRILVGVSGGKDSVLMASMLHHLGYQIVIAHCNFQLRGEASDKDQELVVELANRLQVPVFCRAFDTKPHAEKQGVSIQMSARELRYAWFRELKTSENCQVVAIAQHQQDHIETVFINLARGTGLKGLQGILPKRKDVVRPMLFMTTQEIEEAVHVFQISYRDDESNFSTKYTRNKIRLDILPKFREISTDFDQIMEDNITRFQQTYHLLQSFVDPLRKELFKDDGSLYTIDKSKLEKFINNPALLYELFHPYGFETQVLEDLRHSYHSISGKIFESKTYTLLLDRNQLLLRPKLSNQFVDLKIQYGQTAVTFYSMTLTIENSRDLSVVKDANLAKIDEDKLVFPLVIRKWKQGDRFYPLGMKASKKLSDFFIQEKFTRFEKDDVLLLINGNEDIIWVIGHRIDNRYKINADTRSVVIFKL